MLDEQNTKFMKQLSRQNKQENHELLEQISEGNLNAGSILSKVIFGAEEVAKATKDGAEGADELDDVELNLGLVLSALND